MLMCKYFFIKMTSVRSPCKNLSKYHENHQNRKNFLMRIIFAFFFTLFSITTFASSSATAFGLPIGYALSYKINLCNINVGSQNNICWIESPRNEAGDLIGAVRYQDNYTLPAWAVATDFWIWIKRDGTINELIVSKIDSRQYDVIAGSISNKFGQPTYKKLTKDFKIYQWTLREISIKLFCGRECEVNFIAPELAKRREDIFKEMNFNESKRPISP